MTSRRTSTENGDVMEKLLVVGAIVLFSHAFVSAMIGNTSKQDFMDECMKDYKKYECAVENQGQNLIHQQKRRSDGKDRSKTTGA